MLINFRTTYNQQRERGGSMEESELIARAQAGDKEAYSELIRMHQRTVEKFAFQCGVQIQDIPDVKQEVFIKLYRFLHQFQKDRFTTWLYKIILNTARDYYRKERKESEKEQKMQAMDNQRTTKSAEAKVLVFEEDRALHETIQQLDEKYRYPIILFYFHELSYEQIADVLNLSTSTVKVRMLRAKEQLKILLVQEGGAKNGG